MLQNRLHNLATLIAEVLTDGRIDLVDVVKIIEYVSSENWQSPFDSTTLLDNVVELSYGFKPTHEMSQLVNNDEPLS